MKITKMPQEYIGRKVTSKNLYDTVVGTGNVQIQLYKIEEQREQQISWNQVAKKLRRRRFPVCICHIIKFA